MEHCAAAFGESYVVDEANCFLEKDSLALVLFPVPAAMKHLDTALTHEQSDNSYDVNL